MLAGHRRPVCADYHRRERRIPQRRQQLLRALQRPARAERGPEKAATERDQQPGAEQTEAAVGSLDPVLAGAAGGWGETLGVEGEERQRRNREDRKRGGEGKRGEGTLN